MTIQEIKQQFFSFRNGIVAEAYRNANAPYVTIFGLQVPLLAEIAAKAGTDHELAKELWGDSGCRESRLIACWLFDPEKVSEEDARTLARQALTREEIDMLCFRLFRRLPFAKELSEKLYGYSQEALKRNLNYE